MRRLLAAAVVTLTLVGGARASGTASTTVSLVANPLEVSLALSSGQTTAGGQVTATATVRNLGAAALANVLVSVFVDAGLTVSGGTTRSLASLAGYSSAQVGFPLCALSAGSYVVMASAASGPSRANSAAQLLNVAAGSGQCPEDASATLSAGGTLSTDVEGDGATPTDPVETDVTTPFAGSVSIAERAGASPPTAYSFVGQQVQISAPAATTAAPLRLVFRLDASLGVTAATLQVFRNGVQAAPCSGVGAAPDPCVSARATLADGDVRLTILTSAASAWTFGTPILSRAAVGGALKPSNGGAAAFLAASDGKAVKGAFAYRSLAAVQLTALAVAGRKAWLAGVGADGRTFLAYLEDNGPNGRGDVFKLWIGGVQQTTDGRLAQGDVAVTG